MAADDCEHEFGKWQMGKETVTKKMSLDGKTYKDVTVATPIQARCCEKCGWWQVRPLEGAG